MYRNSNENVKTKPNLSKNKKAGLWGSRICTDKSVSEVLILEYQLTHNMTTDCSLIYNFLPRKIQMRNMLCTKIVLYAKTKTKNNFCTQWVLNLYFSCTEVGNQRTICCHIVG